LLDSLLKIFAPIDSAKTAFIAISTCCGLLLTWQAGISFIEARGVPKSFSQLVLIVTIYGISYSLVEVMIEIWYIWTRLVSKFNKWKEAKKSLLAFIENVSKTVPLLPREQLELLQQLSKKHQTLDISKSGVICLEQQRYIKKVHRISSATFIFEIDPLVREAVLSHMSKVREEYVQNIISNINGDERHFLSLFFVDEVPEGTQESGVLMGASVFQSGVRMANKGVLEHFATTTNIESFRLMADFSEQLTKIIFLQAPMRNELHLDSNHIKASGASGSGACGSWDTYPTRK